MKYEKISEVQNDNCKDNDTYTTRYRKIVTYRVEHDDPTNKKRIIRIDYYQNNNQSSSVNDLSFYILTPSGWENIGNSLSIKKEYPALDQYDCRIDGIKENCSLWIQACKEYYEEIHIAL